MKKTSLIVVRSAHIHAKTQVNWPHFSTSFSNPEFSHIDGRPRFAKLSIDDSKQVKIAAIDPDF